MTEEYHRSMVFSIHRFIMRLLFMYFIWSFCGIIIALIFINKKSISWKSSMEGFVKCSFFVYRHGTILQGICTEKRPCMMKPSYTIPLISFWPEIPKSGSRFRIIFPPNSSAKDGP